MRRLVTLLAALLLAPFVALVTSCSAGGGQKATLPDGGQLLADSARAMRGVTTTHLTLDVQGNAPGVQIRSADGVLTRDGRAQGTAKVDMGRQITELQFKIIGGQLYISGLPGMPRQMPASTLSAYFDASSILNPDRGIAAVLASGQGATTEAREQVDGVDTYRAQAKFPAQPLGALVPGLGIASDKTSELWVATQGSRLVKLQLPTNNGTITAHFSDYDAPVQITPSP
jgi:lipoprotein LprG